MKKINYRVKTYILPITLMAALFAVSTNLSTVEAFSTSNLPSNNLIKNPWFRCGASACLDNWVDATGPLGYWEASQKEGNPTPDSIVGTSARLSTGREGSGATIIPNYDAYLYQVVAADPSKKTLKFDMYWVTHTLKPGEVTVYGSTNPNGPWVQVWKPFNQTYTSVIKPPKGIPHNEWLWVYYSNLTHEVSTQISQGYPYYKVEVHASLPDEMGGFKITGIYFTAVDSTGQPGVPAVPAPVPQPDPQPQPRPTPGIRDKERASNDKRTRNNSRDSTRSTRTRETRIRVSGDRTITSIR